MASYNIAEGAIKKRRVRTFNHAWLDNDSFKVWLRPTVDRSRALCIACNKTIRCCKTDLHQHAKTNSHLKNINSSDINNNDNVTATNLLHKDKVKRAEIKLAAFFAEHNVAFCTVDHLIPLLKDVCIEPEVVQDLSLARHKCAKIVKNVIAKREVENIINCLKICKFSILVDESTDISDSKLMCILVKYVSPLDGGIITQLLELLALDATDCSASKIFKIFKNSLDEKDIPVKNIIGLACDNAPVMVGCNNSFMSNLQVEVPELITLNCLCHTSALIASRSCDQLPSACENLIRGVATYISGSAKRCAILVEFQDFFEVQRLKILKLSNTRWLCFHKCVIRLLDNWDVLKNYFILAAVEEKSSLAENILQLFNDPTIKAYILFLSYSLNFFNNFNALFQSCSILVHKLFDHSRKLIHQMGQNFIKIDALKNLETLDINNADNIKNLENIYTGPECETYLGTLEVESARQVRVNCLNFYITAVREMFARLPLHDPFFKQLNFLEPKIALYDEGRDKIKDLTFVAKRVSNDINVTQLAFEWRILPSNFDDDHKNRLALLNLDKMWRGILDSTNFDGEKMFPNLKLLVEIVLSLPHSNADAERIFSIVTDVKNKKRNQLSNDTVSSICVVRSSFQAQNINCTTFEVDSRHLELHNAQNLYDEKCTSGSF